MHRAPFVRSIAMATALAAGIAAQDLGSKAAPQTAPVLLTNGVLHTVGSGIVLGGSLWFEGGTIRAVWAADQRPELPPGTTPVVVDLAGKHVFPGLIAARSALGLQEIGMVRQTVDLDEVGELTPEAIAGVAVNPDTTAIPVARSNGVLAAAVFPSGGTVPGRVSVLQLDGWTNADLVVRLEAGVAVAWPALPGGEPRRGRGPRPDAAGGNPRDAAKKARAAVDALFDQARAWLDARTADPTIALDVRLVALVGALRGEVPVFLLADELEQIESGVLWATGRGLRAVVVGGRDAEPLAPLLRERRVAVVVDGLHRLPAREDSPFDEVFTLPARLHAAGVTFCLATGQDFSQERNLPYHAATAVAHGLDRQQALAAITLSAAEILGVGDRLGSLTVGKDATLFVADGHPFDLTTRIELAFVQGRQIDLRNKQTELARKYRERYEQIKRR
jgi:imidazolonepropionase-like amidohydrolase